MDTLLNSLNIKHHKIRPRTPEHNGKVERSYRNDMVNNTKYQISLRESGEMDKYIDQYYEILNQLSELSGISYEIRGQSDFNKHSSILGIVKKIIILWRFLNDRHCS